MQSTIAAIASGTGGGIGVIRISGGLAEQIGQQLCHPWPAPIESHRMYHGHVRQDAAHGGEALDEVMFCLFRAPRSYTGQDVLEVYGHGGVVVLARVLQRVLSEGAELAQPGEFTRRAFLAGKLDLTRAEGVAALIAARSTEAARHAQRLAGGELGRLLGELRRTLLAVLGELEGMLDFPDLEEDRALLDGVRAKLSAIAQKLQSLADGFSQGGRALHAGLTVALIGRPNAGKSSLLNALYGAERAIVDATAGTTRDFVEVACEWAGVSVTLIDTAGERADATPLEQAGLRLGRARWHQADLVLWVIDGSTADAPAEDALAAQVLAACDLPWIKVWNKIDHVTARPSPGDALRCSALCGWGVEEVRRQILARLAPRLSHADELLVVSTRQARLVAAAAAAVRESLRGLDEGIHAELLAGEVRIAAARLGEITGDAVSDAVLDEVFSRFCVGK